MTSIRSSGLPHLRLVGPYKLSFEPDGSPLFTSTPLVACWRYEPREHLRPLAKTRPLIPPSPLRDRVGYSDHDRFRGYFPVHFIPAYNLPIYASQRPLPDATQDSVRGCSLGFAAAVIADGRLQRACKAQRSSVGSRAGAPVCPGGPDPHHVSSPLHVARNVRISRIARPHLLRASAYGTYPAGATFGPSRRTR